MLPKAVIDCVLWLYLPMGIIYVLFSHFLFNHFLFSTSSCGCHSVLLPIMPPWLVLTVILFSNECQFTKVSVGHDFFLSCQRHYYNNNNNTKIEGDKDMWVKDFCYTSRHIITAIQLQEPPGSAAADKRCFSGRIVRVSRKNRMSDTISFPIQVAEDTTSYYITVVWSCNIALWVTPQVLP